MADVEDMKEHGVRAVAWADLPADVRRALQPLPLQGHDPFPIVEVQFFPKDIPENAGMAVAQSRDAAWQCVWDAWQLAPTDERSWPAKNPWRRCHTRLHWVWFRRDGPFTNDGLRYQVETDGRVVWVNSEVGLIGRFSCDGGVDVHNAPGAPNTCEDCFPEPDWERFKTSMLRVHGVAVDDKYKPTTEG